MPRHAGRNAIGYTDPDKAQKNQELIDLFLEDKRIDPFDLTHCHQSIKSILEMLEIQEYRRSQ